MSQAGSVHDSGHGGDGGSNIHWLCSAVWTGFLRSIDWLWSAVCQVVRSLITNVAAIKLDQWSDGLALCIVVVGEWVAIAELSRQLRGARRTSYYETTARGKKSLPTSKDGSSSVRNVLVLLAALVFLVPIAQATMLAPLTPLSTADIGTPLVAAFTPSADWQVVCADGTQVTFQSSTESVVQSIYESMAKPGVECTLRPLDPLVSPSIQRAGRRRVSKVQASPSTSASNVQQASTVQTGGNSSTHAHNRRALSTPFTVACGVGDSSDECGGRLADALADPTKAVLELDDGTYTGSTFLIGHDVTLRAKNEGQVILDGENTRRVMEVTGGIADIEGIHITKGNADYVCACLWNLPRTFFRRPRRKNLP